MYLLALVSSPLKWLRDVHSHLPVARAEPATSHTAMNEEEGSRKDIKSLRFLVQRIAVVSLLASKTVGLTRWGSWPVH